MDIMTFVTAPQNLAFLVSGTLLIALFIIEVIGSLIGFSTSHLGIDAHVDCDHDADGISLLAFMNPAGVPLMIFVTIGVTMFTFIGFAIQSFLLPHLLPGLVVTPIALVLTLAAMRPVTRQAGRVLPQDESSDVSIESLTGTMGVITVGPVTKDNLGFIKVRDKFGTDHSIMVLASGDEAFAVGAEVQLGGPHPSNLYAYLIR